MGVTQAAGLSLKWFKNLFAAELLLDTKEMFDAARAGYTAEQIAAALGADVRLVTLKLSAMGISENLS